MADGAKKRKVGELLGGTYEESEEEDEQSQEDLAAQFIVETISSAYILGSTLLIETANEPADKAAFVTACADSVKAALVAYGIPFEEVSSSTKTATATGSETFVVVGGKPTAERIAAVRPGGMLSVFSFYETADLKPTLAKFSEEGSWRVKRVMDHLFHHVELIRKTAGEALKHKLLPADGAIVGSGETLKQKLLPADGAVDSGEGGTPGRQAEKDFGGERLA